ncbi:hypothetical protein MHU86_23885 [Fragilaria crotonensis]|nr:hypothetical protein MHU86_23885 [Fragilaria crotonensis]
MPMPMLFKSSMSAQPRMLLTKMATQQLPINTVFNASLPRQLPRLRMSNILQTLRTNLPQQTYNYKQQLQRASRGIFLGFPDNSAGWLIYSPDQPQSLIITRDAYFDEDFNSALCFDSKPLLEPYPSAPTSIRMDFVTLRTLNHLPTIKLALQPTLVTHHQPSLIPPTIILPSLPSLKLMTMPMKMIHHLLHLLQSNIQLLHMVQHHPHHIKSTLSPINNIIPNSTR